MTNAKTKCSSPTSIYFCAKLKKTWAKKLLLTTYRTTNFIKTTMVEKLNKNVLYAFLLFTGLAFCVGAVLVGR